MTNNSLARLAHLIGELLRQNVYGEITVKRLVTTSCEGTCCDWEPLSQRAYNAFPGESRSRYEDRVSFLADLEDESRICQGHLEQVETVKGMLRSYTFTPPTEDHSAYGTLSMTVLPWDAKAKCLTGSRVIRSRIFDFSLSGGADGFTVVSDYGASCLIVHLDQWRPME